MSIFNSEIFIIISGKIIYEEFWFLSFDPMGYNVLIRRLVRNQDQTTWWSAWRTRRYRWRHLQTSNTSDWSICRYPKYQCRRHRPLLPERGSNGLRQHSTQHTTHTSTSASLHATSNSHSHKYRSKAHLESTMESNQKRRIKHSPIGSWSTQRQSMDHR